MSPTATSSSWKPGDPILFSSPATVSTRSASSSSHTARQPLAAMSKAKQARVAADKNTVRPKQHQSTLSPWAKAAWKPGMRVYIETTARQSTQRAIEADSNRPAHDRKGKQRMIESSCDIDESKYHIARTPNGEHVPFQLQNMYNDPSPSRLPLQPKMIHDIGDESFSSIRAVHNEQSQLDPDSSVEYLGQNSSPRSSALRHLALAQAKLLEAQEKPKSEDIRFLPDLRQDTSHVLVAATAPYCRRRINFRKSLTPPHQAFSTSSAVREATPRDLDWDDPVLNPSVRTTSPSSSSQSSDLPDLPGFPKTRSEAPSIKSQACLVEPTKARGAANATKTSSWSVHAAPVKKAKFTWTRAEKGARDRKKQEQQELLRSKHRTCSYDSSSGVPPKVWYYRSLPSGEVRFMGRDTRLGFVTSPSKDLQSVLDELKGPLAWDLEWETLSWNDDYSGKAQGKVALFQIGDARNIILLQIARQSGVPECLLRVIEDPNIIKLGVQIAGDAAKLARDQKWPDGRRIVPKGLLELSQLARLVHSTEMQPYPRIIGLQRLVAVYLDEFLEKGEVRTSNWEASHLSHAQRKYAANDIYASVQVYQRIMGHAEDEGVKVDMGQLLRSLTDGRKADKGTSKSGKQGTKDATHAESNAKPLRSTLLSPRLSEAWETWYTEELGREEVAEKMNIKPASVTSYIIKALVVDPDLPYDAQRLRDLVQDVYVSQENKKRVQDLLAQVEKSPEDVQGQVK